MPVFLLFLIVITTVLFSLTTAARIPQDQQWVNDRMLVEPTVIHSGMNYLALGDSYASGMGSGGGVDYIRPNDFDHCCFRNYNAYPYLLARSLGTASLDFRACGGATIESRGNDSNTIMRQLEEPVAMGSDSVHLVTVTIGGNDMEFAGLITSCASNYFVQSEKCKKAMMKAKYLIKHVIKKDLRKLDQHLHKLFPAATIVFTGYPMPYPDREPENIVCVVASVREGFNELSRLLNEAIRTNVANFVAISFKDHELCNTGGSTGRQAWMNGFLKSSVRMENTITTAENCGVRRGVFKFIGHVFHPSPYGQQQYSRTVRDWMLARLRAGQIKRW